MCKLLNLDKRALTAAVERERRAGKPIAASCDNTNPGYYLASNQEEMKRYCDRLGQRAVEICKTRAACLLAMQSLPEKNKN